MSSEDINTKKINFTDKEIILIFTLYQKIKVMKMIAFGIVLSLVWIWIFIEIENTPLYKKDHYVYKDHFTIFGIKICKNFRKPKNK